MVRPLSVRFNATALPVPERISVRDTERMSLTLRACSAVAVSVNSLRAGPLSVVSTFAANPTTRLSGGDFYDSHRRPFLLVTGEGVANHRDGGCDPTELAQSVQPANTARPVETTTTIIPQPVMCGPSG